MPSRLDSHYITRQESGVLCGLIKVPSAPLHENIQLRISPDKDSGLSEIRFWHEGALLGIQKVKNSDLNLVHF